MIGAAILLQSCAEEVKIAEESKPVVVQMSQVKATTFNKSFEFPATVSAVKSIDIKFEVSGRLIFENLVEGSEVEKGQVLAQIDPAPFKRKVEESRTRHEDATRDLRRIKEMFEKKVASERELEDAESNFTLTKISLDNALQDLSYCTIKAPFDAIVGTRLIDNNSYVRAGDTVAYIQDRSQLYFDFEVPERIMTANAGNRNVKATAFIIGQEDEIYDIQYVEHQTTPDPITQTYGLTFAIDGKFSNLFYPGSRAIVKIEDLSNPKSILVIPINALVGDKSSGFHVWKYNPTNQSVEKSVVAVEEIVGEMAIVSSGVKADDKVVSAAVNKMRDGLLVKEYKATY